MCRDQKAIRSKFQDDFKQIVRIKSKYRSAVGFNIADTCQARINSGGRCKIREKKYVVYLSDAAVSLVN